jgi:hypothetical protein
VAASLDRFQPTISGSMFFFLFSMGARIVGAIPTARPEQSASTSECS